MLSSQIVANFLNEKLNTIADGDYVFNIMGDVGKAKDNGKVNGIIRSVSSSTLPKHDVSYVEYDYLVALAVGCGISNENAMRIGDIVDTLIETYNETKQFDGKGVITFNTTSVDTNKVDFGVGYDTPVKFSVKVCWSKYGKFATDKHWLLDDVEIPFLTEQVLLNKEGKTSKINAKKFTQTLPTGATKLYQFSMKFDTNHSVCTTLQADILNGNFDKTYELKYYDGVTYTQASPFTTEVTLFNSGDMSSEAPKIADMRVSFTDADNGNDTTRYYMALISFPFGDMEDNTRNFASQSAQTTYFSGKVTSGCDFSQIKAPNINSINLTSQIYTNNGNYSLVKMLNQNYAIIEIRTYSGDTYTVSERFYYWVSNAQTGANNQIIVDLKLDSVQTYMFRQSGSSFSLNLDDAFIEKAHLNRFEDAGTIDNVEYVKFRGGVDSDLFEREDIQNVSKRMTKRTLLSPQVDTTANSRLNAWLNDNIIAWEYVFLNNDQKYTFYGDITTSGSSERYFPPINYLARNDKIGSSVNYNRGNMKGLFSTICIPIYKKSLEDTAYSQRNGSMLKLGANLCSDDIFINETGLSGWYYSNTADEWVNSSTGFMSLGTNNAGVLAIKISQVPPINVRTYTYGTDYEIDSDNNLLFKANSSATYSSIAYFGYPYTCCGVRTSTINGVIVLVEGDRLNDILYEDYELSVPMKFPKVLGPVRIVDSVENPTMQQTYTFERPDTRVWSVLNYTVDGVSYVNKGIYTGNVTDDELTCKGTTITITDTTVSFTVGLPTRIYNSTTHLWEDIPSGSTVVVTSVGVGEYYCVVGAKKKPEFNPKLLNSDYYGLKLTNERAGGFEYDVQKLNLETIETIYSEALTPDITRGYFRVTNSNGVYIPQVVDNLTGFVDSADMTVALSSDSMQEMLSQNKNFYLQKNFGLSENLMSGVVGGALAGGGIGAIGGALFSAVTSKINNDLTIDNMKSAPDQTVNSNGNAYFNAICTQLGSAIEEYSILPNERKIVNDYMFKYGFNYNRLGKIRDFIGTRKYFNYVKANIDNISGIELSNAVRNDLITRFQNGLRFWNSDNIQYDLENYETWLED